MSVIRISHPSGKVYGKISLDGSKSISNRVLIIRALCDQDFKIDRLSTSDDTQRMTALLSRKPSDNIYDVGHAGTTFRFLTAYLATQSGTQILTGSSRMLERPVGPLVEALRYLGFDINYKGNHGYPPIQIGPVPKHSIKSEVIIDSGISSQYITALILIAPTLDNGLVIKLRGKMVSESYLQLSLGIVKDFGIDATYDNNQIIIPAQPYQPRPYTIEADWSASSYHFAIMALAAYGKLHLSGLFENSLQGDSALPLIAESVGVSSYWENEDLVLVKSTPNRKFIYNFINQPDIAQTLAVICAGSNIENDFYGLKTLKIKETDRIYALNRELSKIGSSFLLIKTDETGEEHYSVFTGISFNNGCPRFDTYKDHRMAMAFAPLGLIHAIEINQPEVVSKSYPSFWNDLETLGFVIEEIVN